MAATNDITNAEIKTSAYSDQGRVNHDRIFAKKSAYEWMEDEDGFYWVKNFNGWDWDDGVTMETPISYQEFQKRLQHCIVMWKAPFR